jgi:hypothetical protein
MLGNGLDRVNVYLSSEHAVFVQKVYISASYSRTYRQLLLLGL